MSDCHSIESLVTPYVDGELPAGDLASIDRHLAACPRCRSRVEAERSVQCLLADRRDALAAVSAPVALRTRCRQPAVATRVDAPGRPGGAGLGRVAALPAARSIPGWRARALPLAVAATLLIALASLAVYRLTQSPVRVIAAELTADHVKCFVLHGGRADRPSTAEVEQALSTMFGWSADLPGAPEQAGLELVGARPCLYAEGRVAHIMYRYQGRPVSVFMLPDTARTQDLFEVMGHQAVVWTTGGRTFVLVAREPAADVERLARFVHAGLR